jgi:hypothetical protein
MGLLASTLLCIGLFLAHRVGDRVMAGAGWRAIDGQALQQRLEAGDLSDREASWYHASTPDELVKDQGRLP